jgi:DNA-binding NarL/FixJ family response regulator
MQGKSNKEIARNLNLGEGTVKVHMAALFRVFGVNSRAAVAAAGTQLSGAVMPSGPGSADRS